MIIHELNELHKKGSLTLYDKNKAIELMNTVDGDIHAIFTIVENGVFHFIGSLEGAYDIRAKLLENKEAVNSLYAIDFALEQIYSLIKYFSIGEF